MKIAHLSDLHFGTELTTARDALIERLNEIKCDFIVISGDFTQIGSKNEFEAARDFIRSLDKPVMTVPGNHDIPRFNWFERFTRPFRKYRKYINPALSMEYNSGDVILVGINTARRALPHWNWANGKISDVQLDYLEKTFRPVSAPYKVCVFHHPIHKAVDSPLKVTVFGAEKAMRKMDELGIDLVLTGHVHHASVTTINKTVYCSASTAISQRLRDQENGFNLIEFREKEFEITHYVYKDGTFEKSVKSLHKNL